jgi:hypothetical protein
MFAIFAAVSLLGCNTQAADPLSCFTETTGSSTHKTICSGSYKASVLK